MKKFLSIALAVVMMLAVCVPAFAADTEQTLDTMPSQSGTVMVKTSTTDEDDKDAAKFSVIIPADIVFAWGDPSKDASFTVESHLRRNQHVEVSVESDGLMKTFDEAYTLAYTLDGAVTYVAPKAVVYPAATQALTVNVSDDAWNNAVVEEYTGILTYVAEVK